MRLCLVVAIAIAVLGDARAAALALGLASDIRTLDPHRALTPAETTVAAHVFETLVTLDPRSKPVPALATEWVREDEKTWRLTLRRNVKFQDDTALTAEDVALSLERAMKARPQLAMGGDPGWLTATEIDPSHVKLKTAAAYSLLLQDLALIRIVSAKSIRASDAAPASDVTLAGTGRYRIAGRDGDAVELRPYRQYWGTRATWDAVTLRALPVDSERIDALLSNGVNAIERIPPQMIDRLRNDKSLKVYQAVSGRLMYLALGTHRVNPPGLTYADQASSAPNPLLDRRVRRAISEAIDRRELVATVLHGSGQPAGQLVPRGYLGHVPELYGDALDVADARALLQEAGFPNGFSLTVHGPKDVYPADADVLAAIARMLRNVGIEADAVSEPGAAFASRGSRQQYSAFLRGFITTTRDASVPLRAVLATHDPKTGAGSVNWSRYSNGTLDGLIESAMSQGSVEARQLLLQEATILAMKDNALVPLYFTYDVWATRADYVLETRLDGLLMADSLKLRSKRKQP